VEGGRPRYWEGDRTAWWGTWGVPLRTPPCGRARYWEGIALLGGELGWLRLKLAAGTPPGVNGGAIYKNRGPGCCPHNGYACLRVFWCAGRFCADRQEPKTLNEKLRSRARVRIRKDDLSPRRIEAYLSVCVGCGVPEGCSDTRPLLAKSQKRKKASLGIRDRTSVERRARWTSSLLSIVLSIAGLTSAITR